MPIGTPFFDAFLARLQEWVDDLDLSPEMLTSWVYMAEERFNNELRVLEMVVNRDVMFDEYDQCIPFPEDWLEIVSCHCTNTGQPLRYVSSDEYFRLRAASESHPAAAGLSSNTNNAAITFLDPVTGAPLGPPPQQMSYADYNRRRSSLNMPLLQNAYTYLGRTLYIHPSVAIPSVDVDPTEVLVTYYAMVPPLAEAEAPTPLFRRSPKLYTYATLAQSAPYLVEDQRATIWDGNVTALIKGMNESSRTERVVSSPILMQVRTFG